MLIFLVILHRCYVPFCDHVWTWTGWNSGCTKPRKKGNNMILSYPRSKIATDPNCSFMLIRLFIKMPKRMRTGWVWNSGANCNGRLAVNCQAIAKGSDMRWFVYLCIIFPVKDWHRKKNLAMNRWIRKTLRYFSCGCFCMNSFKISNNSCYVLNGSGRINVIALTYCLLQVSQNTARILCEPLF